MWRSVLLFLSTNPLARRLATRNGAARRIASRFVAGETMSDAIEVACRLARHGYAVELDYLGENVRDRQQAEAARDSYLFLLDRLHEAGVEAHVSLKLTQMGLDVDEGLYMAGVEAVISRARSLGGFVWLDMEGSGYTERTVAAYEILRRSHPNVGIALQAYLYRTVADLKHVLSIGGTVRLCKGAYSEPQFVAYRHKADVDERFESLEEMLLASGSFQAIATHDPVMITHAADFAKAQGIDGQVFEFQMLYGVRRDLQEALLAEGYRVRVYVPFGEEWYPYFMRRLAERPANLLFLLASLMRERGHPRPFAQQESRALPTREKVANHSRR